MEASNNVIVPKPVELQCYDEACRAMPRAPPLHLIRRPHFRTSSASSHRNKTRSAHTPDVVAPRAPHQAQYDTHAAHMVAMSSLSYIVTRFEAATLSPSSAAHRRADDFYRLLGTRPVNTAARAGGSGSGKGGGWSKYGHDENYVNLLKPFLLELLIQRMSAGKHGNCERFAW